MFWLEVCVSDSLAALCRRNQSGLEEPTVLLTYICEFNTFTHGLYNASTASPWKLTNLNIIRMIHWLFDPFFINYFKPMMERKQSSWGAEGLTASCVSKHLMFVRLQVWRDTDELLICFCLTLHRLSSARYSYVSLKLEVSNCCYVSDNDNHKINPTHIRAVYSTATYQINTHMNEKYWFECKW